MERYGDGGAAAELPPGFRFHPTDEELITYYLLRKVVDGSFSGARAIAQIDLNKCEPWDLPEKASAGEKEWYFYSLRDRKYPTGLRTNRATVAGYWKATGKDREIRSSRGGALVGMKKTLVFYRGRAPKGQKTQWVMHEFRLDGTYGYHFLSNNTSKDEWVIARIFLKPSPVPPSRKTTRLCGGLSSTAGDTSCFSDSTSVSIGGGASASSAPRLPDASMFATDGESSSYGTAAANNCPELVPCFSTAHMDATIGIGQYNPAVEPPPSFFFHGQRSLQDGLQLPLFLSGAVGQSGVAPLGAFYRPSSGHYDMKLEGAVGRAPPQMAVGPGQLDGSFSWSF